MSEIEDGKVPELPKPGGAVARALLNVVSGMIPGAGGLLSAAASAWGEKDQSKVNEFLHHLAEMLAAEMHEKHQTILELTSRIDMQDEKITDRVKSPEYQAILRKAFRDWAGTESEQKREFVRNILSNAAQTTIVSDDVVKLFLEWIRDYSELHFAVISKIYNNAGITRGGVWRALGRERVREDSADADLFRLIFHDLSTGRIVRQHRQTDGYGNFLTKGSQRRSPPAPKGTSRPIKSSFDDDDAYELTDLGQQFVHYAMTEVPPKLQWTAATEPPAGGLNS